MNCWDLHHIRNVPNGNPKQKGWMIDLAYFGSDICATKLLILLLSIMNWLYYDLMPDISSFAQKKPQKIHVGYPWRVLVNWSILGVYKCFISSSITSVYQSGISYNILILSKLSYLQFYDCEYYEDSVNVKLIPKIIFMENSRWHNHIISEIFQGNLVLDLVYMEYGARKWITALSKMPTIPLKWKTRPCSPINMLF